MAIAIFDLDETLIDGNSPSLWTEHLASLGWLDRDSFVPRERELVAGYAAGEVSIEDYFAHTLQPLVGRTPDEAAHIVGPFVEDVIEPLIFSDAMRCIASHRAAGDRILIISATQTFLVQAIAERLGVDDVIGTDLQLQHGFYSGAVDGIAAAREGKVMRLRAWLIEQNLSLDGAHFYSDSLNDLPLLEYVEHPHAVNPDPVLRAYAEQAGWDILNWR
jgi:HAD superfamily hydrolase (TIGR01490 family)